MKNNFFLALFLTFMPFFAFAGSPRYQIHDLGIPKNQVSFAAGINEKGEVCGIYREQEKDYIFFWDPENGLIPTGIESVYFPTINKQGTLAGTITIEGWFSNSNKAFIWDKQTGFHDLGIPGTSCWNSIFATNLNDKGQVLLNNGETDASSYRFAIWENGVFHQINLSTFEWVYKINNQSTLLAYGVIEKNNLSFGVPLLYDYTTGQTTALPFKDYAFGTNLNEKGQVIGKCYNRKKNSWNGFLWDPEKGIKIFTDFEPICFNNSGQIVCKKKNSIFLYESENFWILDQICDFANDVSSPWQEIRGVRSINDKGQIVGWGLYNGIYHAFILNPIEQKTE